MQPSWIERQTLQDAAAATGNGSTISVSNLGGVLVAISGTFTATVSFEARGPDGAYYSVLGTKLSDWTTGTSTTATGLWFFQLPGADLFRAPVTWTSGTSVTVKASAVPNYSHIGSSILSTGDLEIGAVELKNSTTDTRANVLAASTAAQATDTPLVVALHPSSPLPAGTAAIGKLAANSGVDIGDVDVTSSALPTGAATSANQTTEIALLGGTGSLKDNGAAWTTIIGVSGAPLVSADLTTRTAVTSAPADKLVVTDVIVSADTAMSVLFEEETSNDDKLKVFLPANGTVQITPRGKLKLAVAAKKLMATASAAGNISILVLGYSEA